MSNQEKKSGKFLDGCPSKGKNAVNPHISRFTGRAVIIRLRHANVNVWVFRQNTPAFVREVHQGARVQSIDP